MEHCGSAAHTAGQLLPFPKAGTQSSNLLSWAEEHRTEGQGAGEGRNCLILASGERRAGVIGSTSQPPGQESLSRLGDPCCWGKTWYAVAMGLWHRGQSGKSSSSMMLPANYFICLDFPFFKMVMAILTLRVHHKGSDTVDSSETCMELVHAVACWVFYPISLAHYSLTFNFSMLQPGVCYL